MKEHQKQSTRGQEECKKDFHEALTNLQIAVQSQVHQADKHQRHVEYKVENQVLFEVYKHNTKGTTRKLQS